MIPRLTKPEAGNKYYIRKADGGYSDAILGKPTDPDCNVLANCSGYSYGRFNEIGQYGECRYLAPVNPGQFMDFKGDCKTGFDPKPGACMVWRKNGHTNSGHVASVEEVIDNDTVLTSESSYNGNPFYTKTRHRKDGNWEQNGYTFLGFIYNPAVEDKDMDWEKAYVALNAKYADLEASLSKTTNDLAEAGKRAAEVLNKLNEAIKERDVATREKETAIRQKEDAEAGKAEAEKERDAALKDRERAIKERAEAIDDKAKAMADKEKAEKEKEDAMAAKNNAVTEKSELEKELIKVKQERDIAIKQKLEIHAELTLYKEGNSKLAARNEMLTSQCETYKNILENTRNELEGQKEKVEQLNKIVAEQEAIIANMQANAGDINGDGKVNFSDVIELFMTVIKKDKKKGA